MEKIISLFKRDYEGTRLIYDEVVPGAEWVINGKGVATRKWDGTCCKIENGKYFKRYDAKGGKTPPAGFIPAQDPDPITGHWPGWIEVGDGPGDRWHREAIEHYRPNPETLLDSFPANWTYELVGPKVQGNPEHFETHTLIQHGADLLLDCPRDFEGIKAYLTGKGIEGIVWWFDIYDPDCKKVKIKSRDFGLKR